jgi:mRNA-degrading endonuclease toxin of MazEF toxin-antitoxin module
MGRRPVIVLSHNAFNVVLTWQSVIVVPVSSSGRQAGRARPLSHCPQEPAA